MSVPSTSGLSVELLLRVIDATLLSIMPDIRSETSGTNQGNMERHFSSKVNFQPDRSVPFTFQPKFRLHHSEVRLETIIVVNGTARFGRTEPIPNIPVGLNRNGPFHLTSARNFRKESKASNLNLRPPFCIFLKKPLT